MLKLNIMKPDYSVAIVGGGFSALVLACSLAKNLQKESVVFEKLPRVGKKILSTGNGRGNFTNEDLSIDRYHGDDPVFAEYALKRFDNRAIRGFFAQKGVLSVSENGRVFPMSLQANALLDSLRLSHSLSVFENGEVYSVKKEKGLFALNTAAGEFTARYVVIASGGMAAKNFGTDGSSYELAGSFGHTVKKTYPSLVQMKAEPSAIKGLKGVKIEAAVSLFDGNGFVKSTFGDLLFTDYGVSGNSVFYLSSYLPETKEPVLRVNFVTAAEKGEIYGMLKRRLAEYPSAPSDFLLSGLVHTAVSQKIARELFKDKKLRDITDSDINKAVTTLCDYRIGITGTLGFDNAQVTRGGVSTSEIDNKTMESKLVKDLFICGEALDIDGDCGGYNLQWAFSSAKCVAEALNERNVDR